MTLLNLLGADGRLDPSHATLAALAKVHVATVQRAMDRLRSLGLLSWQRRLVRDAWRVEQTSNAYILCPSAAAPATDLQIARVVGFDSKKKAGLEVVPSDPPERQAAARSTLVAIAARQEAAFAAAWWAKRGTHPA